MTVIACRVMPFMVRALPFDIKKFLQGYVMPCHHYALNEDVKLCLHTICQKKKWTQLKIYIIVQQGSWNSCHF